VPSGRASWPGQLREPGGVDLREEAVPLLIPYRLEMRIITETSTLEMYSIWLTIFTKVVHRQVVNSWVTNHSIHG